MAFRSLRANLSRLSKTKDTSDETPEEFYLIHTQKCMKHVDSMVSLGASSSVKFNHEQCKYLAEKLKGAVRSALSCVQPVNTWDSKFGSDEDRRRFLEIWKLLFALGKEVESFIQECSEAAWLQFAILWTNVSEHIASLGFDLEFCTIVFSHCRKIFRNISPLSDADVDRIRKAEGEIVRGRSDVDLVRLYEDVEALSIQSRRPGSEDEQRAMYLLERLQTSRLHPKVDLPISNLSTGPERGLKLGQQLGQGASGIVHKAKWLGLDVARKAFHGCSAPDFEREVKIWEGLCHPNIVSLLWYARDKRNWPYMVIELMDGDLTSFMEKRMEECEIGDSPFSISEAVHMMLEVAEGMRYLHEKGIVHRDLKSGNNLVKHVKASEVGTVNRVHAKVADFGLSRTKEKSRTYSNQSVNQGTTRWMAPEMMRIVNDDGHGELQSEGKLKYPFKVDVYSFAMVCFEILTGDMPFRSLSLYEVKKRVLDGERPQISDHCPERLRSLIEACWRPEPEERPGFGDICDELRHMKCAYLMSYAWARAGPRCFSLEEIKKMTNNFSLASRMLVEGFYEVANSTWLRCIELDPDVSGDGNCEVVAVERASGYEVQAVNEFTVQLEVLPRLHHSNVVGYAGFCTDGGERVVVFEWMPNGSLYDWLSGEASWKEKLTWPIRRNICLGVAEGIRYLHSLPQPGIVHRDIKAGHILLDKNLEPKLGGFGLSYMLAGDGFETAIEDCIAGTLGYFAPEYYSFGEISQKVDVYSFGVVLLEIVCGRRGWDTSSLKAGEDCVVEWARKMLSDGRRKALIDCSLDLQADDEMDAVRIIQALKMHSDGKCKALIDCSLDLQADEEMEAVRIIQIAIMCVDYLPERRPDMRLVVAMLQGDLDADISCIESILEEWRERCDKSKASKHQIR